MMKLVLATATLTLAILSISIFRTEASEPAPLFDMHLHYNQSHQSDWRVEQIIEILTTNHVQHAAITSIPPELSLKLHKRDPKHILPILGLYQREEDKQHWQLNPGLVKKLALNLQQHKWSAIGEIHLFAPNRKSPVFQSILKLANQYQLPLILHTDPTVIDSVYSQFPKAKIIWAHAGVYPFPELLRDYLERYSELMIDLSMRNKRIAPDGELTEAWELLFLEYPERFMVGVDTFTSQRWHEYGQVNKETRDWLGQLPEDIAQKIKMTNALQTFRTVHHNAHPPQQQ
jgi:hypothetical protein